MSEERKQITCMIESLPLSAKTVDEYIEKLRAMAASAEKFGYRYLHVKATGYDDGDNEYEETELWGARDESGYETRNREEAEASAEASERAELARLKAKYEGTAK